MSIKKNFLFTVASGLAPVAVTIVTVPIYLELIGEQRYGVMAIVWLITGYFSFFEMGMGRALTQRLARLREAPLSERAATTKTALAISIVLAILGGIVAALTAALYLPTIEFTEPGLASEAIDSVPWIAIAFIPVVLANTLNGVVQAQERFAALAVIRVSTTVAMQVFPLAAAFIFTPKIEYLVAATVAARFVTLGLASSMLTAELKLAFKSKLKLSIGRDLLKFGGWVSVAGLVGPFLVISDRFLIGSVLGAAAITYYTVPYNLAFRLLIIPGSLATVIFPRMSYLDSSSRMLLAEKSIIAIQFLLTPCIVVLMVTFHPLLELWLGEEIASKASYVGQVLLIGVWANCVARVPFAEMQATERPAAIVHWMLWQLVPYLGALYLGLKFYGLLGAAAVWSVRVIIDTIGLFHLAYPGTNYIRANIGFALIVLSTFAVVSIFDVGSVYFISASTIAILVAVFYSVRKAPDTIKRMRHIGPLFS